MSGWDVDAADRYIGEWQAGLEARAERARAFAHQYASLSASGEAEDGLVVAHVDHSGRLTDLRIDDRASGWPGRRIAEAVLAAVGRAQSSLAVRVRAAADELGVRGGFDD
jgi:hypothetical protein